MFDEMIISGLIAQGYTREPSQSEVADTIASSLMADDEPAGSSRIDSVHDVGDGVFRLSDFNRGRHAARELFRCAGIELEMPVDWMPDSIDVRDLDDDGWKMLMAAIAAETFEGSTLGELRELGMIDDDVVLVHFDNAQLDRLRDSLRAEGWRVAVGTYRNFEKWTPTGDNPLGGEGVTIRDDGAVCWFGLDSDAYTEPCEGAGGPEDIRFAGSPTFTQSFKLKG